jgi:hypothetical protein
MITRMADEAKKKKEPANPDSTLTWAEMVKKVIDQSTTIAKTLEPLAKVNRDADGKEQKPIQDAAGLNYQTARALKTEFRTRQKANGGSYDLGDDTAQKAHTLRTRLESCYQLAKEIADDAKDCETQAALLAKMFAQANKPKIAAKAAAAKKAEERARKRRQELEEQLKVS